MPAASLLSRAAAATLVGTALNAQTKCCMKELNQNWVSNKELPHGVLLMTGGRLR
jgi:hypothetical protein